MATHRYTCDLSSSLLREGWRIRLRVSGWSMKPTIPPGSLVRVEPNRPEAVPPFGTVILLELPEKRLLAHRLIDVRDGRLITKGDACKTEDPPHPMSSLIGRIVAVESPRQRDLSTRRWMLLGRIMGWLYPRLIVWKNAVLGLRGKEAAA